MPVTRSKQSSKCVSREQAENTAQYPPIFSVVYMTQLECVSMGKSSGQDVLKALFSIVFNEDRCKRHWEITSKALSSPLSLNERIMHAKVFFFLIKNIENICNDKPTALLEKTTLASFLCFLPDVFYACINVGLCVHVYRCMHAHTNKCKLH